MDDKMRIAVVVIIIAVLAIPLLGKLASESPQGPEGKAEGKAADGKPSAPSDPPLLNAGNLANTKWSVAIQGIPVTVTLLSGGQCIGESPVLKQFTGQDQIQGTWSVEGANLTITASAMGQTKTAKLKISGSDIYIDGKTKAQRLS